MIIGRNLLGTQLITYKRRRFNKGEGGGDLFSAYFIGYGGTIERKEFELALETLAFVSHFQTIFSFPSASETHWGRLVAARETLNGRQKSKILLQTFLRRFSFRPFWLSLAHNSCPWVSEDAFTQGFRPYYHNSTETGKVSFFFLNILEQPQKSAPFFHRWVR